jgi:hypothetical protein
MDFKPGMPKQAKLNFYFGTKTQAASPGPANVNNGVEESGQPTPEAVVANETELGEGE